MERHNDHTAPSHYNRQPVNRVLQNNPLRYSYEIIYASENYTDDDLNILEINSIAEYKLSHNGERPKFNFTDGGDGSSGIKISEETRKKMSDNHADVSGENNPMYGKHHSGDARNKISDAHKGKSFSYGHRVNLSHGRNTTGYLNVIKVKNEKYSQGFTWRYQYYENNKRHTIYCKDIDRLESKVKEKGFPWLKFDEVEDT